MDGDGVGVVTAASVDAGEGVTVGVDVAGVVGVAVGAGVPSAEAGLWTPSTHRATRVANAAIEFVVRTGAKKDLVIRTGWFSDY